MPSGSARLAVTHRFTAERPFLTEADVENEHGGASFVTGRRPTSESRAEGQQPNMCLHQGASRLLESRLFSSVQEHSEDDFICVPKFAHSKRHFSSLFDRQSLSETPNSPLILMIATTIKVICHL